MNYKEFSQKIKAQHPDYADVDDRVLAEKMVAKYPEYAEQVQFDTLQERVRKRAGTLRGPNFSDLSKSMEQRIQEAKQEGFDEESWYNKLLAGSGKPAHALTVAPFKRMMGQGEEVDETLEAYDTATEGSGLARTGEVLGDIAMFAVPGSKIAKFGKGMKGLQGMGKARTAMNIGAMEGAASGLMHQAQNLGQGQDLSLGEFGAETVASAALPFGASAVGGKLKDMAPSVLRQAVKAPRKMMDAINKPNFTKPLTDKLVTRFGGLEEGVENTTEAIKKLANQRDDLIKNSGITVNITDANRKVGKKLNEMIGKELDVGDAEGAFSHGVSALRTAKKIGRKPQSKSGNFAQKYKDEVENITGREMQRQSDLMDIENFKELSNMGPFADTIKKMASYVERNGNKVNKETGMLNSEHIPKSLFGESSDEIASNMGIDESEFMELLSKYPKKPQASYPSDWDDVVSKTYDKVKVSGKQAVDLRKLADKNSKFNPFKGAAQNPDKVVYNEAYRRVLEDEIENELKKKAGSSVMNRYKSLKNEMADLIPFQKAGQFRLGQLGNNYSFSLMDMGALGVGSSMGGLPLAGAMGGFRRLTQTPGGARMLYDMGTSLQTPSNLKKLGGQTLRSLYGTQE